MNNTNYKTNDSIEELIAQLDNGDYSQFENGEYFKGNGFKILESNEKSRETIDFHV